MQYCKQIQQFEIQNIALSRVIRSISQGGSYIINRMLNSCFMANTLSYDMQVVIETAKPE